jgi:DNA-binding transcriptional LysR family regulator
MQRPNDLNDLRIVAAIAETSSLSGAARRLGVNHATAFRRLRSIEARLGVRLFERRSGRYVATVAGEELARVGAAIENEAIESLRKVAGHDLRPSGLVRITTTDGVAMTFLGPIARACRESHAEITVQVITTMEIHNLSARDADIAIRPSVRPPDHLIGECLGPVAYAVYGSRQYLQRNRRVKKLAEYNWVALDESQVQNRTVKWLAKFKPLETVSLRISTFVGARQACVESLGLAVLPCFLGDVHPALKRVTSTLADCKAELWLLMHPDLRETARVKAVFRVVRQELGKMSSLLSGESARDSRLPARS